MPAQPSQSVLFLPASLEVVGAPASVHLGVVTQTSTSNHSPVTQSATDLGPNASVTVGSDGDQFVFTPGIGVETVTNFNWQQDTLELDHFTAAQTTDELQSLITSNGHGDAVIQLGHNDSIVLSGVTSSELQQVIQAGHVLLH